MAQQRVLSEDEITNMITSWDTDDELSSDEENVETPVGSSHSSSAQSACIASDSSEDESDDDSNGVTSIGAQSDKFVRYNRQKWYNLDVLPTCANWKNCYAQCLHCNSWSTPQCFVQYYKSI